MQSKKIYCSIVVPWYHEVPLSLVAVKDRPSKDAVQYLPRADDPGGPHQVTCVPVYTRSHNLTCFWGVQSLVLERLKILLLAQLEVYCGC